MTIFKLESEAVRGMASSIRKTADELESQITTVKNSVDGVGWQSQAREEYVLRLEMLVRANLQSVNALRLMAKAVDRKVDQWEVIAQAFNGPFYFIENVWDSVLNLLNNVWSWVDNLIGSISLPSIPEIVLPSLTLPAIIGTFPSPISDWWNQNKPPWWPFNKNDESSATDQTDSNGADIAGTGESTANDPSAVSSKQESNLEISLGQNDPRWADETMGTENGTIKRYGCLITSIAMIARYYGFDVTPHDINNYMNENNGYSDGAFMSYTKAEQYLESVVGKEVKQQFVEQKSIAREIESGNPVIIHVPGTTTSGHYVLATEVDSNGDYMAYDAYDGSYKPYPPSTILDNKNSVFIIEGS